ncbi:mediator-associated protein 3 [Jatropha curcas]|uniref:mediator-associated protein 3 n=1 Tax=Jatropha curcas TaxID=180498 RepID=UPI0005FB58AA|nr:mediator-associated protein 3 [Jatropha curcas]
MEPEFEERKTEPELSRELEKKISKTVRKILEGENLYEMTENKVRKMASDELGLNLSDDPYKSVVSRAVQDFLEKIKNRTQKTRA